MSTNSYTYMKRWWARWYENATEEQVADRKRKNCEKAQRYYRKHRKTVLKKAAKKRATGYERETAKARAERLADGYIVRCLKQRHWDAVSIQNAREHKHMWEIIREHIKARRELRK